MTLAVAAAVPASTHEASAAEAADCLNGAAIECLTVPVPANRGAADQGTIGLYAERIGNESRKRQAVLLLAGGPGQAATPILPSLAKAIVPTLERNDLITFDQRGTGRSGVASCPALIDEITAATVTACAATLGPAAGSYRTADSVADLDAVLDAFGVEKVTLVGVSYGTHVALDYAAAHPDRVARLVLDSVVGPEGLDALQRSTLGAAGRVLHALCGGRGCGFTRDPEADVRRLLTRWGGRRVAGRVLDATGRPRTQSIDGSTILDLVTAGDTDPTVRAALPAAVRSALDGDLAPLARMADDLHMASGAATTPPWDSRAVLVATTCSDTPMPWTPQATLDERRAAARAAAVALRRSNLGPFDAATAAAAFPLQVCSGWPATVEAPPAPVALPDVPALIVSGDQDVRTPLEDARMLAARLPHAHLLEVENVAHSAVGSDLSGCALGAVRRFLAGGTPARICRGRWVATEITPPVPRTLADVPGRSRGARAAAAVALTVRDALTRSQRLAPERPASGSADGLLRAVGPGRGGGLRGGWIRRDLPRVELHAVELVRGIAVSGTITLGRTTSHLTVSGDAGIEASAQLRRDGHLALRLGTRRFATMVPGGLRTIV